jgi:hypothetical protein
LDLVGKLPTRQSLAGQRPGEPDQWLALIHIEIESPDKATPLAQETLAQHRERSGARQVRRLARPCNSRARGEEAGSGPTRDATE